MTAGLPGIGIGGIFYLTCALFMPFVELFYLFRGRSSLARWKAVLTQFGFLWGIMAGFWLTGWVLGKLIPVSMTVFSLRGGEHQNAFRFQPLFISLATMVTVFGLMGVVNFWMDRRKGKVSRIVREGNWPRASSGPLKVAMPMNVLPPPPAIGLSTVSSLSAPVKPELVKSAVQVG